MSRRMIVAAVTALLCLALLIGVSALWNDMWKWLPWSDESRLARARLARDRAVGEADARHRGPRVSAISPSASRPVTPARS